MHARTGGRGTTRIGTKALMSKNHLTAERLRELVEYDQATGLFSRKVRVGRRSQLGPISNAPVRGYHYLSVDGTQYPAHRLAWFHVHGVWPNGEIDHMNGDGTDNRIQNLRDVDRRTNGENRHKVRKDSVHSGVIGVTWSEYHKKWKALIRVDGRLRHLKYCATKEEAREVYVQAKRQLHAGCVI